MAKKLSHSFHHDWQTMVLAVAAAGLALYIGLLATSQARPQRVAGESTSINSY